MAADTLDFEEPVNLLQKEIDALRLMPQTPERKQSIARLEARTIELRAEIFANLGPWQRVQVARHPNRPCTLDYVERLFTEFTEVHGDRRFADDKAIIAGFAFFHGEPVMIVGHQKGRDTKQKIYRNFGYAKPEGYRKALRVMTMAEKFRRPVISFIDTPAAYPGIESEERGVAEAIALNLREMSQLSVPVIVVICGEGGSGGALGIAVGDRVLMQEFGVYSVIPPEGCAAILWRDAKKKVEAAIALKITAPDLLAVGIIDEIVKEPIGGAHLDYELASEMLDEAIRRHLGEVQAMAPAERLDVRYQKFRAMGRLGQSFEDAPLPPPATQESLGLMLQRVWDDVPAHDGQVAGLAADLGVPSVISRLLWQRGLTDPARAQAFLNPGVDQLNDPFLMLGMRVAVDRILGAIARQEPIAIHGDYDVDGVTSTVILRRAVEMLGGSITHFVPDRHKDGYGLQPATIDRLHAGGARLVISVDCGIRATAAAERARDLGVDLIITDHHEPEAALPPALAVLNPKRADCSYPEKGLAGVGVALKVVQALMSASGRGPEFLPHFLKVAAIGTLADVVPLTGENRVIAHCGLTALSSGRHAAGLEALLAESGLLGKTLDSFHVSFILAPRLNAAGRMGSADTALDLLLMKGRDQSARDQAQGLARLLTEENTRRQAEEAAIVTDARRVVDGDPDIGGHNMLVVSGDAWHRGVIGIVASKLVDAYCKPALVLSVADGVAHGSGRSIGPFNLLEALESCHDVFLKFGGHKQAAGVTLEAARVPEMRRRLTAYANERLSPHDLVPRLRIDSPLGLRDISSSVLEWLNRLGPFGAANPKPVFRASPIDLVNPPKRLKERHLSLIVRQDGRAFRAVAWRASEKESYLNANRNGLELAYSLEQGEFRGEKTTELTVADVRMPAGATA